MENIIEAQSLTKRFSKLRNYRALLRFRRCEDLTAVDAVSLQVREGELFGLLGPNGAGKTTLVKMLCTLILPSQGRALVCGKDVVAESAAVKPLIGLVDCQDRSFFWRLSGRQNLQFFAALYGLHGQSADSRIDELLCLVGLNDHAERRFMDYSSGMRQKLAVARGLLSAPPLIFMDEPTRSLDPVAARDLRSFIRATLIEELGCTVFLVTHRLEEAEELCDRVAIMNQGRIVACGPVAEIKRHIPAHQVYHLCVQNLFAPAIEILRTLPGVVQIESQGPNLDVVLENESQSLPLILRTIVSHGGDIEHCQTQGLSLEEAFIHLMEHQRV